jgi:hypothetical protein
MQPTQSNEDFLECSDRVFASTFWNRPNEHNAALCGTARTRQTRRFLERVDRYQPGTFWNAPNVRRATAEEPKSRNKTP